MSRTPIAVVTPTETAYDELQHAYDHFNARLFEGKLPPCLITLNNKGVHVYGYFSKGRYAKISDDQARTDEIALNPIHFKLSGLTEAMQTLVHEMAHLWQDKLGTPSRKSYHNTEWADKMEAIGLMPSSTGKPGGARVGQQMADYPIPGGPFDKALKEMTKAGFQITWYDRIIDLITEGAPIGTPPVPRPVRGERPKPLASKPGSASGRRVKFVCRKCQAAAWGASSLDIECRPCGQIMKPSK